MTNRRDFLKSASLLTLGGLVAGTGSMSAAKSAVQSPAQAAKSFGLQTYSLQREINEDIAGGLKKVKAMGYSYIELAGYNQAEGKIGQTPMADYKKMADDAGLKIVSSHLNPPVRGAYSAENRQQISEFWKKAADHHAAIGCEKIIQPGQPSTPSVEQAKLIGEVFNDAGRIAKAAGLSWGYHNHDGEFARVVPGGTEPITGRRMPRPAPEGMMVIEEAYMEYTDPSLVFFELDVYWTVMGQNDPVEFMKKHPTRINKILHIKDKYALGQSGMMNFENIFKQAYANGVSQFIVELESVASTGMTQLEGAKASADYLKSASFVR